MKLSIAHEPTLNKKDGDLLVVNHPSNGIHLVRSSQT